MSNPIIKVFEMYPYGDELISMPASAEVLFLHYWSDTKTTSLYVAVDPSAPAVLRKFQWVEVGDPVVVGTPIGVSRTEYRHAILFEVKP